MKSSPSTLVLLPARAGSLGLKGKNRRRLGRQTLLKWSCDALKKAGLMGGKQADTLVLFSSDDRQLIKEAKRLGVEAPFIRPKNLAGSQASLVAVSLHALAWLKKYRQIEPERLLLMQLTSPLRSPQLLKQAMSKLRGNVEAVIGVKSLHRTPRTLFQPGKKGILQPLGKSGGRNLQRQQLPALLTPNGALYLVRVAALKKQQSFLPKRTVAIAMNAIESLDLDDATDWQLLEAVVKAKLTWRDKGRRRR